MNDARGAKLSHRDSSRTENDGRPEQGVFTASTAVAAATPTDALLAAGRSTWAQRSESISHLATALGENAAALELSIANGTDMSRPDAAAEVRAAIDACVFYGRNAQHWSPGTRRSVGLVVALTPLGYPLWRLTRLLLPVLMGGGVVVVTRPGHSARTVELLARAVESAGFPPGTLTLLRDAPRPSAGVRTRRATYNYGAYPFDSPGGHAESMVVTTSDDLPLLARSAVRRAGAPGSPVLPTTIRLVATPAVYEELCREVANAVRDAPAASWPASASTDMRHVAEEVLTVARSRGARVLGPDVPDDAPARPLALTGVAADLPLIRRRAHVPLILLDVAHEIDSALDLAQGTALDLGALLWDGAASSRTFDMRHGPWQISEVWSEETGALGADEAR